MSPETQPTAPKIYSEFLDEVQKWNSQFFADNLRAQYSQFVKSIISFQDALAARKWIIQISIIQILSIKYTATVQVPIFRSKWVFTHNQWCLYNMRHIGKGLNKQAQIHNSVDVSLTYAKFLHASLRFYNQWHVQDF